MRRYAGLICCALLGGCAGNGEGLDANGRPDDGSGDEPLQPTFSSIQDNVFTPICSVCHSGASAPVGLRLDEGNAYALLVNQPSAEVSTLNRVTPGDPDNSYLIHKIEGTAAVGGRMPLNQPPLPADVIAVIRQWIAEGAQDDTASGASGAPQLSTVSLDDGTSLKSAPDAVVLASDRQLDSTLLQAQVITLIASGGDGSFLEGNEREIPLSIQMRSHVPTVLAVSATQWREDTYELRVSGSAPLALTDLNSRAIDGDRDGLPGGDLVVQFVVEKKE